MTIIIRNFNSYQFIAAEMNKVEEALDGARKKIAEDPVESFRLSRLAQSTFIALHEDLSSGTTNDTGSKAPQQLDEIVTEIQRAAYKNMGNDADKTLRAEFGMAAVIVPHGIKNGLRKLLGQEQPLPDLRFKELKVDN